MGREGGRKGVWGEALQKISMSRLKMKLKCSIILNNLDHNFARGEEM